MQKTPIQETRDKLAKIYGVGVLIFIAIFGSLTGLALLMSHWSPA